MLFDVDDLFGHVINRDGDGAVYADDGTTVDFANPRSCFGCKARCVNGQHDPCIANLPSTRNACCGHGQATRPTNDNPSGYVALEDGRTFRFAGTVGGAAIRAAVDAAIRGEALPEGFVYDEELPWWHDCTDEQKAYVQANIVRILRELVVESGATPSAAFDAGEAMWWDGLDEEQKSFVLQGMGTKLDGLVVEAKAAHPA
jgi:hypothetical protein